MTCGFAFILLILMQERLLLSPLIRRAYFLAKTSFTDAGSEAGDAAPGEEKSVNLGRIRENPSGYRVKVRNGGGRGASERGVRRGGAPGEIGVEGWEGRDRMLRLLSDVKKRQGRGGVR